MTAVEKLIQPRVKMIAPVPEYGMQVGTIITIDDNLIFQLSPTYGCNLTCIRQYPHIYKELAWWEERGTEELESVKFAKTLAGNSVRTVKSIIPTYKWIVLDGGKTRRITNWLPATEEEYINFQNSKNKTNDRAATV